MGHWRRSLGHPPTADTSNKGSESPVQREFWIEYQKIADAPNPARLPDSFRAEELGAPMGHSPLAAEKRIAEHKGDTHLLNTSHNPGNLKALTTSAVRLELIIDGTSTF